MYNRKTMENKPQTFLIIWKKKPKLMQMNLSTKSSRRSLYPPFYNSRSLMRLKLRTKFQTTIAILMMTKVSPPQLGFAGLNVPNNVVVVVDYVVTKYYNQYNISFTFFFFSFFGVDFYFTSFDISSSVFWWCL